MATPNGMIHDVNKKICKLRAEIIDLEAKSNAEQRVIDEAIFKKMEIIKELANHKANLKAFQEANLKVFQEANLKAFQEQIGKPTFPPTKP